MVSGTNAELGIATFWMGVILWVQPQPALDKVRLIVQKHPLATTAP